MSNRGETMRVIERVVPLSMQVVISVDSDKCSQT